MDIIDRIKEFFDELKFNGVTAKSIAENLNISYKTLSNYINGERYLPLEHINSICNLLDISVDYFLGFTKTKQYDNSKKINVISATNVGLKIKEFRKENKITQEKLAKSIESSKANISRYEKGKYLILTLNLYLLCKNYKISADYLLGKIDEPKYFK